MMVKYRIISTVFSDVVADNEGQAVTKVENEFRTLIHKSLVGFRIDHKTLLKDDTNKAQQELITWTN